MKLSYLFLSLFFVGCVASKVSSVADHKSVSKKKIYTAKELEKYKVTNPSTGIKKMEKGGETPSNVATPQVNEFRNE
jgi:hypothetical protein